MCVVTVGVVEFGAPGKGIWALAFAPENAMAEPQNPETHKKYTLDVGGKKN